PDSVTEIGDWAFNDCSSLQSIVIPDSVTKIGKWAFNDCSSLQSIVIPQGTKEHFEELLYEYYHKFIEEIDYKKIYNGIGFCYEFGMGYKRNVAKAEEYYAKAKDLEDKEKSNEIICDDDLPF
ncbi:MAG: leucine-rich repeat protein, partial [Bacteroidales bacterium]|nr:leucine-rich repeat protein [Bacteroidales bacterium]